jgi:DNA ligase-1
MGVLMNVELLDKIEMVGSKLAKESLLAGADGELRLFIEQCLDPDITYGITIDEDDFLARFGPSVVTPNHPSPGAGHYRSFWSHLRVFLDQTAKRLLTGNSAQAAMISIMNQAPDEICAKWAARFINKNLRAGFDIRTYNKVFGEGTVAKFAVQLADVYEGEELRGDFAVQPKLDGNRVVLIDGKAMSRNGKEYPNCQHVIDELLAKDPDFFKKWVVDGEMMGDLGFDQSSGALRRINEKNREKATFTYWAFDLIDRKEWEKRKTKILRDRVSDLSTHLIGNGMVTVKLVPTIWVESPTHAQLMQFCDDYVARGFEGAMVKDVVSPYVFKQGRNLLKVKRFKDADLRVTGFYEGKGKHKGRLGGLIVEGKIDGRPCTTRVGSGFDDATREMIWNDQKGWMGATVAIQYQDFTKDGSLRFPVFLMRRKDKED